jgi:hypothetical protein
MFKKILIVSISIFFAGCISPYTTPVHTPYVPAFDLVEDGTQKMKECKFECQKEKTQCSILTNAKYSNRTILSSSDVTLRDAEKRVDIVNCQKALNECFTNLCGGKVIERKSYEPAN